VPILEGLEILVLVQASLRRVLACFSRDGISTRKFLTSQSEERFGVAHTIEASDFDQLAPEDGLQAFVAIKVYPRYVIFDR
jgi:hypothetical protein